MNIFRIKVKEVYVKVTDITILGKKFEVKVAYKNVKVTELNVENREVKIVLPMKYKNKDIKKILNVILNKMYEQIAKKEVEAIMEKIRSKLKFAPEDYKIAVIKNTMAKCNSLREIIINPYIARYDIATVEYIILHEYCHLKYKTHSKGFWELIKTAMPQYQRFEYAA
jgi:predicted metal-dependent hydrolase